MHFSFSETAREIDIGYFILSIGIKKYTRTSETPEDKPKVLPPQCHWKLGKKISKQFVGLERQH